ncbi:M1 family metallopeptidase [Kitasatospora sp. NPDC094015]|uniref:M1 family metallopeptidase n=1 Tax=Kitasatospora sp. NPDC094015 TaxID=3155205 RepID=UPI0033317F9A
MEVVVDLKPSRIGPAVLLAAAMVWSAGSPAAPFAPRGPADPVYPALGNAGYDVQRYDLDLTYRAGTRTVDATAEVTARAGQRLPSFELDALGLDVHAVLVDGAPAAFRAHDEKLTVLPRSAVRPGALMRVSVRYTVDPHAALAHTGWVRTADGFALAGQPDGAHTVFPCNDVPSDKAQFSVRITAPDNLTGVASGALTGTGSSGGQTTRTYVSRDPIATELLQVSVGTYTVRQQQGPGGLPLRDVVPTARAAATEPALALTAGQLGWLEQRLGPFPFETYGLLPADTDDPAAFDFTGLETQTLTLYKPGFLLQPEAKIGSHMVHELTHSWFGDSVTPQTWADLWLNEGHADYYGLLYRYERGWPDSSGFTTLEARMKDTYARGDQWRHDSGPVAAPNAANLYDSQRYLGGVLALYALQQEVGDQVFNRIEREFLKRFHNGNASTRDYIATASQVAGRDLGPFLTAWLYGDRTPPMPHHPDWTVTPAAGQQRAFAAVPRGSATL